MYTLRYLNMHFKALTQPTGGRNGMGGMNMYVFIAEAASDESICICSYIHMYIYIYIYIYMYPKHSSSLRAVGMAWGVYTCVYMNTYLYMCIVIIIIIITITKHPGYFHGQ
jgi:hypothetical protein